MKQTLALKLQPSPDQADALTRTMTAFNAACNAIAEVAYRERSANKVKLQKLVYYDIRTRFDLSAQLTVRAIAKVAEAYKRDKTRQPRFRPTGAITYDQRILSFKGLDRVSLLTLDGRQLISFIYGMYQAARLDRIKGQADLVVCDEVFYLYATIDVPEPPLTEPSEFLGVDLGIVNLATDSDGTVQSGKTVQSVRHHHARLRQKLQSKGTKSAKRLLKKRRRKETRFQRDVNHCLSKRLVAIAQDTGRGLALEDLTGIRDQIRLRRAQRRSQHRWAFRQLRAFIEYKARLAGVSVVLVNPRHTSRMCPACGHCEKANRRSQSRFSCVACSFAANADVVAAMNIGRAAVNQPHADAAA
ncbi:MAG: IS200/IS605 family element transposase accessory protein TnpB [Candidatus Latescibacteria bacterium]|nr:IS200/IS605 family element transposase accessory protein TnpB [Candidatus Latescibacterota bacterium]